MTGQNKDNNDYGGRSRIENKLTRYFDDLLNDVGLTRANGSIKPRAHVGDDKQSTWTPAIDIRENDREYVVIADVPGVGKEDLDVEFHDTLLVISGQNKQDPLTNRNTQEIGVDKDHNNITGHHQDNIRKDKQPEYYQPAQPGEQQHYQQQPPVQQPVGQQQQPGGQQPVGQSQYQKQSVDQHQQPTEQRGVDQHQQPTEQRYQQQGVDQHQQPTEQRYQQQGEQLYQQHPAEEQQYQHPSKHRQRTQGERVHIQERPYGYFSRTIQLPNNIKAEDDFYASLNNGVLKIKIPKSNERPRKKITIT